MADFSTGEKEHHDSRIHSDHALLEHLYLKGVGNEVQGDKRAGSPGCRRWKGEQGVKGPGGTQATA